MMIELRTLLGIDEFIHSEIQSKIWDHESDKHDTHTGCSYCW